MANFRTEALSNCRSQKRLNSSTLNEPTEKYLSRNHFMLYYQSSVPVDINPEQCLSVGVKLEPLKRFIRTVKLQYPLWVKTTTFLIIICIFHFLKRILIDHTWRRDTKLADQLYPPLGIHVLL